MCSSPDPIMDIAQLPDDILVLVFRWIEVEPLLTVVRAVCRRWRELALHQDVWMHRVVSTDLIYGKEKLLQRILQDVPYANQLYVSINCIRNSAFTQHLILTTSCCVETLYVWTNIYNSFAEKTVSNQIANGRLRQLELNVGNGGAELADFISLVKDLLLDKLAICRCDPRQVLSIDLPEWGKGSVKTVVYRGNVDDNLLPYLLRAHTLSIESVDISVVRTDSSIAGPFLSLLPKCIDLTNLALDPPLKDLNFLRDCSKLSCLHLDFNRLNDDEVHPDNPNGLLVSIQTYFRSPGASRLLELKLSFYPAKDASNFDLLVACFAAFAENGNSSALKDFIVIIFRGAHGDYEDPGLDRLAVLLPRFPRLQRLVLDLKPSAPELPAKLRDCLRPGVLPDLRSLNLRGCTCSHTPYYDWMHLQEIVRVNPQLEINVEPYSCPEPKHSAVIFRSWRQLTAHGCGGIAGVVTIFR